MDAAPARLGHERVQRAAERARDDGRALGADAGHQRDDALCEQRGAVDFGLAAALLQLVDGRVARVAGLQRLDGARTVRCKRARQQLVAADRQHDEVRVVGLRARQHADDLQLGIVVVGQLVGRRADQQHDDLRQLGVGRHLQAVEVHVARHAHLRQLHGHVAAADGRDGVGVGLALGDDQHAALGVDQQKVARGQHHDGGGRAQHVRELRAQLGLADVGAAAALAVVDHDGAATIVLGAASRGRHGHAFFNYVDSQASIVMVPSAPNARRARTGCGWSGGRGW